MRVIFTQILDCLENQVRMMSGVSCASYYLLTLKQRSDTNAFN